MHVLAEGLMKGKRLVRDTLPITGPRGQYWCRTSWHQRRGSRPRPRPRNIRHSKRTTAKRTMENRLRSRSLLTLDIFKNLVCVDCSTRPNGDDGLPV
ncbi:hypothetical protein LIA77_05730 [Sarocladium implicatum]|nr:hypothetical protein LIA77_05730 [Sarocladium implicatum]